jgi:hypothetical protein
MDLEIEGETASEESRNEKSESESESETSGASVDRWKEVTVATRNPRHTCLLRMQDHNLTFCQMQSPWIIFSLLFNDELLNNIVTELCATIY